MIWFTNVQSVELKFKMFTKDLLDVALVGIEFFTNKENQYQRQLKLTKRIYVFFSVRLMYFLEITIDFISSKKAKDFFASIKPELDEEFLRSKTKVSLSSSKMNIELSASDKTALRASFNALVKPLNLFMQLEEF